MATNTNLTVTISAVDRTSQAIDAVARRLAGITAPVTKVSRSLARLSDASGITKLSKAISHLGGSAVGAGLRMTEALAPLSGLTAALSLGGLAKMTSDWAKFSQSLGFDAARIGSNVSDLHALEGSARLSGVSAEAAASGLRTLQDVMTDTVDGRNMQALVYFRRLGVEFEDGRGNALRATAVLPKLADAIAGIKDPSRQARVAVELFGSAGEAMLPWLKRGSAGIAEYNALARHYGVQTEASTEKAGRFQNAQTQLALAFQGLGNSISEKVSPPLARMMVFIAELVNKWRKPVSDTLGEWAERFGKWISNIDWESVGRATARIAENVASITDSLSKGELSDAWKKLMRLFGIGGEDSAPGQPIPMPRPSGVESEAPPLTPGQHTDAGRRYMGMLEDRNWSHDDAAAIIAGLDRESGLREKAEGDKDKNGVFQAYGAAQWHPDRQKQFDAWSKNGGTPDGRDIRHSSMDDQIRFIDWDLKHSKDYARVGDQMRAAKTREEKVAIFDRLYEAPKDTAGAIREDIGRASRWAALTASDDRPGLVDTALRDRLERYGRDEREDADVRLGNRPEEPLPLPRSQPEAPAAAKSDGTVKVDVSIRGLPAGATATAISSGAAAGGVRIERAMP